MFRDREALKRIYPSLVHHAVMSFGAEEVLRFWGRPGRVGVSDEVMTDRRRGSDGVRVKHWVNKNSLKFYDKGSLLRVEATINEPRDFRSFRAAENNPRSPKQWRILRRSVADFYLRAPTEAESALGDHSGLGSGSCPSPRLETLALVGSPLWQQRPRCPDPHTAG